MERTSVPGGELASLTAMDDNSILGRALRPRGPVALRLRRRTSEGLTVIEAGGELDLLTVTRLAADLDGEVRQGLHDVVVDLRTLEFIDSAGLHVLLNARRRLARQGRALGIVCTPGDVHRVFELSRLIETLEVTSSLREFRARRAAARPPGRRGGAPSGAHDRQTD